MGAGCSITTGATAALNSVAGIDFTRFGGGASHIIDLHPTAVSGEEGADRLASLVRTFFDSGGMNVGFRSAGVQFIAETIASDVLRGLLDGTTEEPF